MKSVYGTAQYAVAKTAYLNLPLTAETKGAFGTPQSVVKRCLHEPKTNSPMMRINYIIFFTFFLTFSLFAKVEKLFSGSSLDAFEFAPNSWGIDSDGSIVCRMEKTKDKKGIERLKGMGYLWTRNNYGDFSLTLDYKLSEGANSGIFYRTNPKDPVQGGFEIQLMDNEGFQKKSNRVLPPRKAQCILLRWRRTEEFSKPVGQWNKAKLTCKGQ